MKNEKARKERVPHERKLRIVTATSPIEQTPVVNLEQIVGVYAGLMEQTRQLDELLTVIRDQILRAMRELEVRSIRDEEYEVIRQIRHRPAKLDQQKAEVLLKRFDRFNECVISQLDDQKVRTLVEELLANGSIGEDEVPYGPESKSEVLVLRR
jgi:hypothetical protein